MTAPIRYDDLLKTAEWRVFAYQCKERAGFRCAFCEVRGKERLQAHHWWYDPRHPWRAERNQIAVVCAACHEQLHDELETFKRYILTQQGQTPGAREGLRWFRRYVFPGLSPEAFRKLNAQLMLGTEEVGAAGAAAVRVLAGVLETSKGCDANNERELNAGRS